MLTRWLLSAALVLILQFQAAAFDKPIPDGRTEADKKLEVLLDKLAAYLDKTPLWTVDLRNTWQTTGLDKEGKGHNQCRLTVQNPGKFRLEFRTDTEEPNLICISDGKVLTRLLPAKRLWSRAEDPLRNLRNCALTIGCLQGAGADFFLQADLAEYVLTQAKNVEDKGIEESAAGKVHHFKMLWSGQRELDVWLAAEGPPLVRKFTTLALVPSPDKKTVKVQSTCTLTWKVGGEVAEGTFAVKLPQGARQVNDLLAALLEGGMEALLGKPAPLVDLEQLGGGAWKLADHKGKEVVVLYFWASWAAPSVAELPGLRKFIEDYKDKGVVFYAINVGEKEDEVKEFIRKYGWKTPVVIDPQSKAAQAYHVTSIPVAVVLGKDGTVQTYRTGSKPEEAQKMRKALDALLAGKSLAP